jgi:hypothetical protein
MATEFDPRRNIPPPEGAELTPVEKARKKIEEYLKTSKLKSTRFRAFDDYTRMQLAEAHIGNEYGHLQAAQTINRRMNSLFGGRKYIREYEEIDKMASEYKGELTQGISDPREKQLKFYDALEGIKSQELARRSQQSQTSRLFTRISQRFTR